MLITGLRRCPQNKKGTSAEEFIALVKTYPSPTVLVETVIDLHLVAHNLVVDHVAITMINLKEL